jgi:adenine phosphoribosyltransferase
MSDQTTITAPDIQQLKSHFQFYPDYPKKGVNFVDILPVLRDPLAFELLISHITSHIFNVTIPKLANGKKIDAVVGLDARGFLLGPIIAMRLGAAFVAVRKQGKLPGECVQATYAKEYGQDIFEMQASSLAPGSTVLIIDDLIATGGSAHAAGELVEKLGSKTVEYIFVVGLPFLNGASKLNAPSYQ